MLALKATAEAKAGLRSLRTANPELFGVVSERITTLCGDPSGRARGHTFRLDDDRTSWLATYFDIVAQKDLVLVWFVEEHSGQGLLHIIAVEHEA